MGNKRRHTQQHHLLTTVQEQCSINQDFDAIRNNENLLPVKVTRFFKKKIDEELAALNHTEGPLHRIVYPSRDKVSVRAPGEVRDFVDDRKNMPNGIPGTIIQKYKNRVLFLPTSTCAAHCQYCFRQDILSEQHTNQEQALEHKIDLLKTYLQNRPEINEVILSGGDPMTLSLTSLDKVLSCIKGDLSIESIRIHTKTISYSPHVFKSEEKLRLLQNADVRLVFHLVHPYEICGDVRDAIRKIRSHGIRCYNQFPILRKINDHPDLLIKHLTTLDNLHVRNLSIFVPEPIHYSAAFRISLPRLLNIIDALQWHSASWINATRFVLDTPVGKVRRENMIDYDEKSGIATFARDGKQVQYPDLPAHLDVPGDLNTMLWKDFTGA